MPEIDENVLAIAEAYATALLDLSEEQGVSDEVLEELSGFVGAMRQDQALRDFMTSPAIDEDDRRRTMEKFRGNMSDLLLNTLLVMNSKGRASIIEVLLDRYQLALDRRRGRLDVEIVTARPLSEELRGKLAGALEKATGKEPILSEEVDDSLLGGIVVRIGDRKYDYSVATQLESLRESLMERSRRELAGDTRFVEDATV